MSERIKYISFLLILFFNVINAPHILAQGKYLLMTSKDVLSEGDKVIIVCRDYSVAMSTVQNSNYRGTVNITFDDEGKCSLSNQNNLTNVQEFIISNGKIENTFAFGVGNNKFLHGGLSSNDNLLRTKEDITESSSAKITLTESGTSVIEFQGPYNRNKLQCYGANKFACYSSNYYDVSLFRYVEDFSDEKPQWQIEYSSSECEVTLGDTYQLPTLSNSQGAEICYSSSNEEVATIETNTGIVTIHSAGQTVISATAQSTETFAQKTVSYALTIHEKVNEGNVTFNFQNPETLGLQTPSKGEAGSIDLSENTPIINSPVTMFVSHGNNTKTRLFNANGTITLRIYKGGGAITLSVPTGYLITNISFTGSDLDCIDNLKSKKWSGKASSVNFSVKENADKNPQIKTIEVSYIKYPNTFTITSAGYATYFTNQSFVMPDGVDGAIITAVDGQKIVADYCYTPGTTVPAFTGLLLRGQQGNYSYKYQATDEVAPANNLLHGLLEDGFTVAEGNVFYYKLANDAIDGLGFYWGEENGGAFQIAANKAYLAVPQELATRGFSFKDLEPTNITTLQISETQASIYDLNGRAIKTPLLQTLKKGIYILNGKKFIVK